MIIYFNYIFSTTSLLLSRREIAMYDTVWSDVPFLWITEHPVRNVNQPRLRPRHPYGSVAMMMLTKTTTPKTVSLSGRVSVFIRFREVDSLSSLTPGYNLGCIIVIISGTDTGDGCLLGRRLSSAPPTSISSEMLEVKWQSQGFAVIAV